MLRDRERDKNCNGRVRSGTVRYGTLLGINSIQISSCSRVNVCFKHLNDTRVGLGQTRQASNEVHRQNTQIHASISLGNRFALMEL